MSLDGWLARQEAHSAKALAGAISARALRHHRPGFGVDVVPAAGSVLASPVGALWDPEPDYFYHWVRDAAVVMLAAGHMAFVNFGFGWLADSVGVRALLIVPGLIWTAAFLAAVLLLPEVRSLVRSGNFRPRPAVTLPVES